MDNELWKFWFNHQDDQIKRSSDNKKKCSETVYFVFDSYSNQIDFLSENILKVLGYQRKDFTIISLMDSVYPEDEQFVVSCERICLEFQNSLFYDEHFRYSYRYSYRIISPNKKKLLVHQSYEILEVNEQGYLSKAIVKLQVSEIPTTYIPDRNVKIFDLHIGVNINDIKKLSKREQEIVTLIYKGFTSVEIARKLFVSKMTIDTHRRNILHKTNSNNFIDLMQKLKNL